MTKYVPTRAGEADQLLGRRGYTHGGMRWSKSLLGLAIVQLALATFVFVTSLLFAPVAWALASASASVAASTPTPTEGSALRYIAGVLPFAILAAVLTLIGAGMGIGAFRCCRTTTQRCLVIAHYVLEILTIVVGLIAAIQYVASISFEYRVGSFHGGDELYFGRGGHSSRSLMAMLWIGFLSTTALVITCMISACFTCNAWCSGDCREPLPGDTILTGPGLDAVDLGSNTPTYAQATKSGLPAF